MSLPLQYKQQRRWKSFSRWWPEWLRTEQQVWHQEVSMSADLCWEFTCRSYRVAKLVFLQLIGPLLRQTRCFCSDLTQFLGAAGPCCRSGLRLWLPLGRIWSKICQCVIKLTADGSQPKRTGWDVKVWHCFLSPQSLLVCLTANALNSITLMPTINLNYNQR